MASSAANGSKQEWDVGKAFKDFKNSNDDKWAYIQNSLASILRGDLDTACVGKVLDWLVYIGASNSTFDETQYDGIKSCLKDLPKRMCAYEFKPGDIAWNCKNCQVDDTCVLCNDCFMLSNHEGHEVFFYYTHNGGCCDCGDTEAWDAQGFCKRHSGDLDNNPVELLPELLKKSFSTVTQSVVTYILETAEICRKGFIGTDVKMLEEEGISLEEILGFDSGDITASLYDVIVHGNDLQSTQEFVESLEAADSVIGQQATPIMMEVCDQGLCTVTSKSTFQNAVMVKQRLQSANLMVSIVPSSVSGRFSIAIALLNWLGIVSSISDGFCRIISDHLTQEYLVDDKYRFREAPGNSYPILRCLILADAVLPKPMIHALHSTFMALLADPKFKRAFAISFADEYDAVYRDYVTGIGTAQDTVLSFGVQFLNRASFVKLLVEGNNLFQVILNSLQLSLEQAIPHRSGSEQHERKKLLRIAKKKNPMYKEKEYHECITTDSRYRFDDVSFKEFCTQIQSLRSSDQPRQLLVLAQNLLQSNNLSEDSEAKISLLEMQIRLSYIVLQFELYGEKYPKEQLYCSENWAIQYLEELTAQQIPGHIVFDVEHKVFVHRRYLNSVMDLRYVIQVEGISKVFVKCEGIDTAASSSAKSSSLSPSMSAMLDLVPRTPYHHFLRLLSYMQNLYPQLRRNGDHIQYEKRGWLFAIDVVVTLGDVFPNFLQRYLCSSMECANDNSLVYFIGKPVLDELFLWFHGFHDEGNNGTQLKLETISEQKNIRAVRFSVSKSPVSSHFPLHRCIAQLFREFASIPDLLPKWIDLCTSSMASKKEIYSLALLEYPLRAIVQAAQTQAGMWVRNGASALNHTINYSEPPLCTRMRDLDLLLVQFSILLLKPEIVLSAIICRFEVLRWFLQVDNDFETFDMRHLFSLASDCMTFFCQLSTELPLPPEKDNGATFRAYLKREIIHRLVAGPCPHSDLAKLAREISRNGASVEVDVVNDILQEVSTKAGATLGKYQLKEEYYTRYDSTFLHLSRQHHETAREGWQSYRSKSSNKSLPAVVEPLPCNTELINVRLIILHSLVSACVRKTFLRAVASYDKSDNTKLKEEHSAILLSRSIHVVTLQVYSLQHLHRTAPEDDRFLQFFKDIKEECGDNSTLKSLVLLSEKIRGDDSQDGAMVDTDSANGNGKSLNWILEELMKLDSECKSFIQDTWKSNLSHSSSESLTRDSIRAKRKAEAQKRALLMMKKQQEAFAKQMMESAADDGRLDESLEKADESVSKENEDLVENSAEITTEIAENVDECAMCHEQTSEFLCYVGFAQRSSVLGQNFIVGSSAAESPKLNSRFKVRQKETPLQKRNSEEHVPLHMQLCGHVLHYKCWDAYHSSQFQLVITGGRSDGQHSIDVTKGEFLCPMCKGISNILVPHADNALLKCESLGDVPNTAAAADSSTEMVQWLKRQVLLTVEEKQVQTSEHDLTWMRALEKLCMVLHRVATGSSERARPDRYLLTSCRALSYTIASYIATRKGTKNETESSNGLIKLRNSLSWLSEMPDLNKSAAQKTNSVENLKERLVSLFYYGGSVVDSVTGSVEYELNDVTVGQTKKQSLWKGASFPRAPLMLNDLLAYVSNSVIVWANEPENMIMVLRWTFLSRLVQSVLAWSTLGSPTKSLRKSPRAWDTENKDEFQNDEGVEDAIRWFSIVFGGSSAEKPQEVAALLVEFQKLLISNSPFQTHHSDNVIQVAGTEEDASDLLRFVSLSFTPFLKVAAWQLQRNSHKLDDTMMLLSERLSMCSLKELLVCSPICKFFATWCHRLASTYEEILDPKKTICGWIESEKTTHSILVQTDVFYAMGWDGKLPRMPELPLPYVSLYSQLTKRVCSKCKAFPSRPAICLVCGDLLCAASTCPKREQGPPGSCTIHAKLCARGSGIFFLVLEGACLLVYRSRAAYFPSLYVDEYGEEFGERHKYINRGRPLYLDQERFESLYSLWATHGIPKEVVRIQNGSERVIRNNYY